MAVLEKTIPVPSEYFDQLPPDVRIRWIYRNTDKSTGYSMYELADKLSVTTMTIRAALARLSALGKVHLVEERSHGRGYPVKFYWVEPI
ncbi:HTH domain-containing protein [Calothrix sp. NIES-2098]|uniref:HTH domain-containing protein n=1 Tax=Calothrix sp. NIES-2098 TaxID=1954171 RepID=UPI000B60A6D8|nr:hypothetical protein NIES2098_42160 [Calothrix sp. NIES-2098]